MTAGGLTGGQAGGLAGGQASGWVGGWAGGWAGRQAVGATIIPGFRLVLVMYGAGSGRWTSHQRCVIIVVLRWHGPLYIIYPNTLSLYKSIII